jgi:4-amino-4-deoxy-L-arabinose transferase-like glycosyltransferase
MTTRRWTTSESAAPQVAWRPLLITTGVVVAVLGLTAGRYGYHRDELYFLQAGHHLAWGYVDQPPLTPLVARLISAMAPDSLIALRLPSALAAGLVVLLTGLIARELGAPRRAQLLAAACMAMSALLLAVGHLLSTSTFDLLVWTAISWLVVRVLRGGDQRLWLGVGLLAGVGLLNKTLVAFLAAGLVIAVLTVGPRDILRNRWLWVGAAITLVIWSPNLAWQASHGWPQLELSKAIAAGSSGTSVDRAAFVPYQLVLISPLLVPVWLVGLVRLLRDPALRRVRAFGWTYLLLLVVFVATGGKPYYLGGLYPVLLAAGAEPTLSWLHRGRERVRRFLLGTALTVGGVVSSLLMLPLVPASLLHATPVVAINYDAGETVGWPRFAAEIAAVYRELPDDDRARAVLLTRNYGEAGALDRYGPRLGLSPAYSGHNSYWSWGPPPETGGPVIAVGLPEERLQPFFGQVRLAGRIDNGLAVDNDEQGAPIWICRRQLLPWAQIWPQLRRLG